MNNLNTVDPCMRLPEHFGSIPFYHIDTFEDLCRHILFIFAEIVPSNSTFTVDLMAKPFGLFIKPAKISFLLPNSINVANNNDIDDIDLVINQNDQV